MDRRDRISPWAYSGWAAQPAIEPPRASYQREPVSQVDPMSTQQLRYDWTYADYARLPDDGNHYEVLDGELLVTPSPSPWHQIVGARLLLLLDPYVQRHRLGLVIPDVDLLFQSGQFLRPDLLVVPEAGRAEITNRGVETAPMLVVEILSPTSGAIDRVKKPSRYGHFGVPEYWVLDPEERCAWVWRFAAGASEPEHVAERLEWRPSGASEPLEIELEELLEPLWRIERGGARCELDPPSRMGTFQPSSPSALGATPR